jgi:phosphatidylglycerophosphate synthase
MRAQTMAEECVVLADIPGALTQLCGISVLERLLRTLQRCGFSRATVLSSPIQPIARELAQPSWARAELDAIVRDAAEQPVRIEQIVALWPEDAERLLVVPAGLVCDSRLLRLLLSQKKSAALIDSAVPKKLSKLTASALNVNGAKLCGPALMTHDWARSQAGVVEKTLHAGLEQRTLTAVDVADVPLYYAPLNRELRAYWFPAPFPDDAKLAKKVILASAQKGTLDLPAIIHSRVETFLVSLLCETPVTPNQLSILTNLVAWTATILLGTGRLGWGLALALIVGVLDGLDGKQARVKVETTKLGKLEHWFDAFFEVSWWVSLAYFLRYSGQLPTAFGYLALLLLAQGIDGILKCGVRVAAGKSIEELGTFERFVHLIAGRRNVFVWLLMIGFLLGAPAKAFIVMAWLALVTAVVHSPRAIAVFSMARKSQIQEGQ